MKKTGIIGIGKLGICFALNLEAAGYPVIGVDIRPDYVESINNKTFDSQEPQVNEYLKASRNFTATTNIFDTLQDDIKVIFLLVATPSTPEGGYDHRQVERVTDALMQFGKRKQRTHLVVGCTTMPGYCNALSEKMAPYNYTVSYNPEFIAQGSIMRDLVTPDQVLIGEGSEEAGKLLSEIYRNMCKNQPAIHRMDRLSAEICKLATNCFLTTKISFANSIGDLAIRAGADPNKILSAIGADSRIGPKYLGYGFGYGGPCFPRDNRALGLFARQQNYELLLGQATDEVNKRHLIFQTEEFLKLFPADEIIEFDYVTYKKNSILLIESQQLELALNLARAGRKVRIRERKEIIDFLQNEHPGLFILEQRT